MLAVLLVFAASAAHGVDAHLDVSGEVVGQTDDALEIRVGLANRGSVAIQTLQASAELLGHSQAGRLDVAIAPHATGSLAFAFPLADAVPGVHALTLRLEYQAGAEGQPPQTVVQAAYVLIALGESAPPAVRITAPEARMDSVGRWRVALESADGIAHRVRLRVVVPRTLRADPLDTALDVPATGRVEKELLLFRVDAPWESPQGVLLVAATDAEPVTRTTVATALVHVGREPGRMARLRPYIVGVMVVLFLAAAALEVRRHVQARI